MKSSWQSSAARFAATLKNAPGEPDRNRQKQVEIMATRDENNEISLSFRLKGKKADAFRKFIRLLQQKAGFECTYAQTVSAAVDMATKVLEAEGFKADAVSGKTVPATGE